jgi:hypothetical protein
MLKMVEIKVLSSRLLEPCRAIAQRQPSDKKQSAFTPPRREAKPKIQKIVDFSLEKEGVQTYPLGLFVDISA